MRVLSGMAVVRVCKLLYDIDPLHSDYADNFVDVFHGDPIGTFELPPAEILLEPKYMVLIKKEIYIMLNCLVDGSEKDIVRNLMMHLNPLCLLRDMFKVPSTALKEKCDLETLALAQETQAGDIKQDMSQETLLKARTPMCKSAFALLCTLQQYDVMGGQYDEALRRLKSGQNSVWDRYYKKFERQRRAVERSHFRVGIPIDINS